MSSESRLCCKRARAWLVSRRGTLAEQRSLEDPAAETRLPEPSSGGTLEARRSRRDSHIGMFNGIGVRGRRGRYVVVLGPGAATPMPWINVIGQPDFGFRSRQAVPDSPGR
jgi:cyclic beta-1,2-glucan synthetase